MVRLVEACHPDPYERTGGKMEYNLAFHRLLTAIPNEGMSVEDFWWRLSGFLALIGDGHTYLYPVTHPDAQHPGGIPVRFRVLADSVLAVERVPAFCDPSYIGSRVVTINGIAIDSLVRRVATLYPMENMFDRFRNLKIYLWYGEYLKRLLPDWEPGDPVTLQVMHPAGEYRVLTLATDPQDDYQTTGQAESSLHLPNTTRCDFVFDWIGHDDEIGYLRIDKQDEFREYAEQAVAGLSSIGNPAVVREYRRHYLSFAHQWHERYYGNPGPDSLELIIETLPSFTEFMVDVTSRLKQNNTRDLIIDLRNNRGGISLMSDILIYFLFGKETLNDIHSDGYVITYHSELNCRAASSLDVAALNRSRAKDQSVPLQIGDYDFYSMQKWLDKDEESKGASVPAVEFSGTKTFSREYVSGEHEGWFTPEHIWVIGSDGTFSAGYETLVSLIKSGATFVGVPSAQSGNCYGMGVEPVKGLTHSGIRLQVSVRKIMTFPDNPQFGYQIEPAIPLDFTAYIQYGYDQHAAVLVTLDHIYGSR
ncbi:hypothetical protein JXO52_06855 [bacterium]|nr:hypothetical protein [bacterium]